MVLNATFNNISVITWHSILMVKETGVTVKTTDLPQIIDKLYHIKLYRHLFYWSLCCYNLFQPITLLVAYKAV